ncbi:glycosyl hydrolase [Flavivirga abyssicola]|uniref:glycosyl hydrolase n=1 Tax=Flavivirga abyssicola TaxID=3063533 RepID=UPI0026DF7EF6|nr:glycosyl hydrolase [Flavivirga sp. MEBiC07777]WVK12581.1 glycosyl hydrolase [Flavivirga sp. MEBiC07777]
MKKGFKHIVLLFVILVMGCSKDASIEEEVIEKKIFITITSNTSNASEPQTHSSFTIRLSESLDTDVTVFYTVEGNATNGLDYNEIPEKATIATNTLSTEIPITIINDSESEEIETVKITLDRVDSEIVKLGTLITASINITNEAEEFLLSPSEARFYVVNPNATPETIALFYHLNKIARTSFIIGQQDAFSSFFDDASGISDMKKTTGNDPGLLGSDFMFITDDMNNETSGNWFYNQEQTIKSNAIEAYNKGMVNTFLWHMREPYEGDHFYTSNMTDFQKTNAFKSILPSGENHAYYKSKLDKIAKVCNSLIGNDGKLIPIIFRPFHEFDGNWFWWGKDYCTPQEFIDLWRFTVNYLKNTKGVNNMLFAYASDRNFNTDAEYLERYPGDNYVDILGMDNYGDFNQGDMGLTQVNAKLKILTSLAKQKVKIAALTESCFFVTPGTNEPIADFYSKNLYNSITENDVKLGYMMFWSNIKESYCVPTPSHSNANDFILFANKPNTLLQNELPSLYKLPN